MQERRRALPLIAAIIGMAWSLALTDHASAATNLVRITSTLEPPTLTITPGAAVTWRNDDTQRHRVRTTSGPSEFDSGDLDPGESFTVALSALGTYAYRDDRDPELSNYWGSVIVATASASPTPGTPGVTPPPPPPGGTTIGTAGRAFNPSSVTIPVGGTVTWRNDDSREHTVTSTTRAFDSGLMSPGATFVRTFPVAGSFPFLCLIHPDMSGTVTVLAAPGVTPPPPTPTPAPTATPAAATGDVTIVDFAFTPSDLTVDAGARVTFANRGAALHTVTATDGSFDSGLIAANGTYQRTFATPGTFPFLCALHPTMAGTIRVRGLAGATPPPAAAPTPKPPAPPGAIRIVDFSFQPGDIRITAGQSVTWVNTGVAPHTVTSKDGGLDSGIIAPGASYRASFPAAGTFGYICAIHPDMTGVVRVAGPDGAVPPPSAGPPAPEAPTSPPEQASVDIVDLAFQPDILEVEAGSSVRFVNRGVAIHTATGLDGSFDTGFLETGESAFVTFSTPGSIRYVCAIHPSMVGTIVVTAATGGGGGGPGGSPAPGPVDGGPTPTASPGPAGAGGGSGGGGPAGVPASEDGPARSPLSVAAGLLFILLGLAGGFAVIRGIGRRAGERGPA